MRPLEIRAIQPDNESAIRTLVDLFSRTYGRRFPNSSVYDPRFWKSRIGAKLVSVGLYAGKEIVAHAALVRDRFDRALAHIAYPACEPDMLAAVIDSGGEIDLMLARQAERQGWRALGFAAFGDVRELRELSGAVFKMSESLLLPNYHPLVDLRPASVRRYGREPGGDRPLSRLLAPLVVARRELRSGVETVEMHVPGVHAEIVATIVEGLGLRPRFAARSGAPAALPADGMAIERYRIPGSGVTHSFVQPSLLSKGDISSIDPGGRGRHSSYAHVDLGDPACPYVCSALEDLGFGFAGVVPRYRGKDSIVYFKTSEPLAGLRMFGGVGEGALVNYIDTLELPKLHAHGEAGHDGAHETIARQ